ncbi:MAG: Gfo/Idh/MocA family oxidoreductase, partial [Xanthomonadales bacterium]|nr:Gfo/Idh/MocA family oxidoreductase [Xanthomonadales bacterium]
MEALQAGKHVLCEKPLARNPQECQAMVAAALRSDRTLATGFNYRFYPSIRKARELLDSGIIGELDHIRSYAG